MYLLTHMVQNDIVGVAIMFHAWVFFLSIIGLVVALGYNAVKYIIHFIKYIQ